MTTRRTLATAAIVGQIVFVLGWLVGGAIEGHGYSFARHDISDLGALTAQHPLLYFAICAVGGFSAMAFALGALRPAFGVGAVLLALSLPSLDSASDTFFRLDCRAADHGCSMSDAATSWHGKAHIGFFLVAALFTIAAPFVLSARMRAVAAWRDLARPTRIFGIVFVVGFLLALAAGNSSGAGLVQRVLIVYVCTGVCLLARRELQIASSGVEVRGHRVDGGVVAP
jgi:uncharacterized protein DUF998